MKNVIVIGRVNESTVNDFSQLKDYHFQYFKNFREIPEEVLAEGEILIGIPLPEYTAKMPKLEWVQLFSAGANRATWLPENVLLTNAYGAYGPAIAEYLTANTLSILQLMPVYQTHQKYHEWEKLGEAKLVSEIKVLSVGMGSIGSAYLERMHALGAECYGVRRTVHEKPDYLAGLYTTGEIDTIIGECDVVALTMPETPETIGMFNEERMRKMKPGAILLNIGRGTAIVTDDLVKLANEKWFRGVVLDVTDPEPLPKNHPLWNCPNVYITPHISGRYISGNNYNRVLSVIYKNLVHYAKGEPMEHVVDKKLGY
ncbi:MAG: D-2-hydroxyacid dehydrogenase [Solobacterium sp.]|nr:D-2-hydroxyacid dehydrogenase [Solobacterium sp.]